ncbi:hypothetical protein ILYODFUR_017185 [Ilyodon furcidens]|uniref:Uncharacterized protein n=1 Tax=Ilyodon furcidens TaxID=33524 RepID=A0ABV0SXU2_9TELE
MDKSSLKRMSIKNHSIIWGASQGRLRLESMHQEPDESYTWATSVVPGPRKKRQKTGMLLSDPKSSFQIKVTFAFLFGNLGLRFLFGKQDPRLRSRRDTKCNLKSSVKFSQSVMIWGAMLSAGLGPQCSL